MASSSGSYVTAVDRTHSSPTQRSPKSPTIGDDSDIDDFTASFSRDQALLAEDPLEDADEEDVVSFKRKQKQTLGSRFFSSFSSNRRGSRHATTPPRSGTPTLNLGRSLGLDMLGNRDVLNQNGSAKDGGPLDWYVEGPGRRVGYEDLTAIDWIFEYTKERQRLRVLYSSATGFLGYMQQFLDASQIWVVLILTGLAVGVFAAAIDIVTDWLGDLKSGYCSAGGDGGQFYLNKYFCCLGYDGLSQCQDWVPWSRAFHITSVAGTWFIEYFCFVTLSVSRFLVSTAAS